MSNTANLDLERPDRGDPDWDTSLNSNMDKLDAGYGNNVASIADLPEVYIETGTFNYTVGDVITLPKSVDAINEYNVTVTQTTGVGTDVGMIYVSKAVDDFTVYCAGNNTTDTYSATIYYIGDVASYGGSIYRRWYVSPDASITDHGDDTDVGSFAWILDQIGITLATVEFPGNKTYTITTATVVPDNVNIILQKGAVFDGAGTLTFDNPGQIIASPMQQVFGTTITVVYTNGGYGDYPGRWGAKGDGSTDDGVAINRMADACRLKAIPIKFAARDYYTTISLNFSNANNSVVGASMGWTISGSGEDATRITGNLIAAHAVVDMCDNELSLLENIRIEGHVDGSQFCGVLHAQVGTGAITFSLNNTLRHVAVAGTFSEAGYINAGADLTLIDDCFLYGPIGALFTTMKEAIAGSVIVSAYNTLTTLGQGTKQTIRGSWIQGIGGDTNNWDAALVVDETLMVDIISSYIAQDDDATSGILVDGTASDSYYDIHSLNFISSRYENQSDQDGTFLKVASEYGLRDCILEGYAGGNGELPDLGQVIYLSGSNGNLANSIIKLTFASTFDWTNIVQRSGTQVITNCQIYEQLDSHSLLDGKNAALFGVGNTFYLKAWHADWGGVGDFNTFFTSDYGLILKNFNTAFSFIGDTTSLARMFVGHVESDYFSVATTGPAGSDETLNSYTLPGDISYSNTFQNVHTLRVKAFGNVATNGNAKTIEGKFGVSGAEVSIITNDITGSPNNVKWEITVELIRTNMTTGWSYNCTMTVGAVTQSTTVGTISADPDVDIVKFLITGDAAASDIVLSMFKVEIF